MYKNSLTSIEHTAIAYKSKMTVKSQLIYSLILLTLFGIICSLPFIKTSINISSRGVIQSSIEKSELIVPITGRLSLLNIKENQKVFKGDTLLIIDSDLPKKQNQLIDARSQEIYNSINDISKLINCIQNPLLRPKMLTTGHYDASWQQYSQELENARLVTVQAEKTFTRYNKLYLNKFLTESEYEKYKFELEQAQSSYLLLSKKYKTQWQTDIDQFRTELRQLSNQRNEFNEQRKQYTLVAGISGSIQAITGLQNGSFVFTNQKVGEISPDSNLIAYCYITPADIGLIKKGQTVRMQIDAFNYNNWGLAPAIVEDISDDVLITEDKKAVFKVKCKLMIKKMKLNNNYIGYLKKGMTLTGRFLVTERSLYDLLYDKVDDWVNPNSTTKI